MTNSSRGPSARAAPAAAVPTAAAPTLSAAIDTNTWARASGGEYWAREASVAVKNGAFNAPASANAARASL